MFTWADLLLATGAIGVATAAGLLTQVLKAAIPKIFEYVTGGTVVFIGTGLFYLFGGIVLHPDENGLLALFLSWLASAAAALGIHNALNSGAATFIQGAPKDNPPAPK